MHEIPYVYLSDFESRAPLNLLISDSKDVRFIIDFVKHIRSKNRKIEGDLRAETV